MDFQRVPTAKDRQGSAFFEHAPERAHCGRLESAANAASFNAMGQHIRLRRHAALVTLEVENLFGNGAPRLGTLPTSATSAACPIYDPAVVSWDDERIEPNWPFPTTGTIETRGVLRPPNPG